MAAFILILIVASSMNAQNALNYNGIAKRILTSLHLQPGERVLIRYDPTYFAELIPPLREGIRSSAAVDLAALEYVADVEQLQKIPSDAMIRKVQREAHLKAFSQLLESADVYLWLPASRERDLYQAEEEALSNWLKKGGTRREIHFHWRSGSMVADGLPGEHNEELDRIYENALDISYEDLSKAQDEAISVLRSGPVRVTTPEGTDLTFQVGARPFNKQNGDASGERAQVARMFIDREIELPAGVLRVAPIEDSANGIMVIPKARFGDSVVSNLRLKIQNGRVIHIDADENLKAAEQSLKEAGEAAYRFREFGLGFNPKLNRITGSEILPYYGYGAGIVRLSLGDNQELGGNIKGGFVRWFFFPNATVKVKDQVLVEDGKLKGSAGFSRHRNSAGFSPRAKK
jgi:leucyl aminopeptidase (aminopeptidase T)